MVDEISFEGETESKLVSEVQVVITKAETEVIGKAELKVEAKLIPEVKAKIWTTLLVVTSRMVVVKDVVEVQSKVEEVSVRTDEKQLRLGKCLVGG